MRPTSKGYDVMHGSVSMLNCSNYAGDTRIIGLDGMYGWPSSKIANEVGVGEVMQP